MNTNTQSGFTLYELLITLLVIGVMLSLGAPNLQTITRNNRVVTIANDLHASFLLARSEAARSRTNVTICGSLDPMSATAACDGTFEDGWIVFSDVDGNTERAATEGIIRAFPAVDDTIGISANGNADYFSFASTGIGRGDVAGAGTALVSAAICDSRGNQQAAGTDSTARVVVASPTGRAVVVKAYSQITTQIGNNSLACP